MNKQWVQLVALATVFSLAAAQLFLIGYMFDLAVGHVTADGKVPVLDASVLTALLLSFQTTMNVMRSIWESQERTTLAESLSNSTPTTPAPKSAVAGAQKAADGAQDAADLIKEQGVPA